MPGYVFLSNSNKPTEREQESRGEVNITNVSRPCLEKALSMGFEVWLGINRAKPEGLPCELPVHMYDSHTYRNLFAFKDNLTAYKNLMDVLKKNDIKVIHCNTPIGGIMGRLCGKRAKIPHIIYTAHGFHFYKGAPLLNRTILKWAEMIMARWTDVIITMNQEDYEAAQKFKLRNQGKVYYVPGVGIDTEKYRNISVERTELRKSLGLKDTDIVCISMGDIIPRKNYGVAIKAIAQCKNSNIHYLIAGKGQELRKLEKLACEQGVSKQIHFLGFRSDIKELLQAADIFLFTTLQEGMPRSMMEAMASGLPCIASRIRGNVDLLEDGKGGYLIAVDSVDEVAERLNELAGDSEKREEMAKNNLLRILDFDTGKVKQEIEQIYEEELQSTVGGG